MLKLAITTNSPAAGKLLRAKRADRIIPIDHRLVMGSATLAEEMTSFFASKSVDAAALQPHWSNLIPPERRSSIDGFVPSLSSTIEKFDEIEVWVDPDTNSYLMFAGIISHLRVSKSNIRKIRVIFSDKAIAKLRSEDEPITHPRQNELSPQLEEVARQIWESLLQSTPVAFANLLFSKAQSWPPIYRAINNLLGELPSTQTALGSTEKEVLHVLSRGSARLRDLVPGKSSLIEPLVYDLSEVGRLVSGLTFTETPAITGLTAPYSSIDLNDTSQWLRFHESELSLTTFGLEVLHGRADFAKKNTLDKWWAGVRITNNSLWRWNSVQKELLAPDAPSLPYE